MILPRQRSISHRSIWSNKRCFLLDRERERHEDKEKEGTFRVWFIPILCAPLRIDFPRINYPTNLHRDYVYRKLRVITQHSFSNIYIYIYITYIGGEVEIARGRGSLSSLRGERRERERSANGETLNRSIIQGNRSDRDSLMMSSHNTIVSMTRCPAR